MQVRHWLRPPRLMLVVFVGVALVSSGALGWLGWLLLAQDAALDVQRRQEALDQTADRAAAAMQRSIADLRSRTSGAPDATGELPPGVSRISLAPGVVRVWPEDGLLYYPFRARLPAAPSETFNRGEQYEFADHDLDLAAREYSRLSRSANAPVRAGALARLARVRRKQHDPGAALTAYEQLSQIGDTDVDGLPATLVATVGRASVFDAEGRLAELRREADALRADLARGRWRLAKTEYDFYTNQAGRWLGMKPMPDASAAARADAVAWLWQKLNSPAPPAEDSFALLEGPTLVTWRANQTGLDAVVAGPAFLASLCTSVVPSNLRCALSDPEGRTLIGDRPPARMVATRTAAAAGLPWTLHVSAVPDPVASPLSPRRRLLMLTFGVVGLVLLAGWYFILRAISRELRVSRLQSDFVAAVSHEFRSPLTSMSHIAEMLADNRFPDDAVRRKAFGVLVRDTDRLRRLVEGLLDFGRFEAGAATLRLEAVDVAALVRATVADFQERVAQDGYRIELTGASDAVTARADREALARALWNLLDNAVKYSPECRTVWVEMSRHADQLSIEVQDQGIGIPIAEQREIFDRFVRGGDSKARRISGTGIGLAMVREIVRAHGGEILLTSEPGRGSRFTVVLRTAGGMA
jgi:signal transduction histidine kinase